MTVYPRPEFIILGAGGHAAVVADLLSAVRLPIRGTIGVPSDATPMPPNVNWLGKDNWLEGQDPDAFVLANGVGLLPRRDPRFNHPRKRLYETHRGAGWRFPALVHPSAALSASAQMLEGAQIMAGSVVQTGVQIGENVIVNTGAQIDHHCRIGAHCHIGPGATLCGEVCIGDTSFIGAGAIILPGLRIGKRVRIAAGAVVARNIPDDVFLRER